MKKTQKKPPRRNGLTFEKKKKKKDMRMHRHGENGALSNSSLRVQFIMTYHEILNIWLLLGIWLGKSSAKNRDWELKISTYCLWTPFLVKRGVGGPGRHWSNENAGDIKKKLWLLKEKAIVLKSNFKKHPNLNRVTIVLLQKWSIRQKYPIFQKDEIQFLSHIKML